MNGILKRYLSDDGSVVCTVLDGTAMIAEMERIHQTSAVVTAALGRLSMAASMIGYGLKSKEDTVTIRIDGGGPAGVLVAVAKENGTVKSYVDHTVVELPLNAQGKLDVAAAVGTEGTIYVIKDMGLKEPYVGQIQLVSGEIAEDITQYFAVSEQIPTACGLGVLVDTDLTVKSAGGYLIQLLPGAPDDVIDRIEAGIHGAGSVTALLEQGLDAAGLITAVLGDFSMEMLETTPVEYRCYCSRSRVESTLISLGREELQDIARGGETVEVDCQFCDTLYAFTPEDVAAILKKI